MVLVRGGDGRTDGQTIWRSGIHHYCNTTGGGGTTSVLLVSAAAQPSSGLESHWRRLDPKSYLTTLIKFWSN